MRPPPNSRESENLLDAPAYAKAPHPNLCHPPLAPRAPSPLGWLYDPALEPNDGPDVHGDGGSIWPHFRPKRPHFRPKTPRFGPGSTAGA